MPCHYDCSEDRTLAAIPDYSDISGLGVVIGYTATAGITVFIITIYYFIAHNPDLDPFRSARDHTKPQILHTPNPVDKLILRRVRNLWRSITKNSAPSGTSAQPTSRNLRLEKALLKCVLTLSDLQILTGLSILISGYAQLHCGLSVYHWQILVYLSWFSSLTHLSCLTFLRNHLYNHPGERLWRLIGMSVLVIMLIVALLPTGNYSLNSNPADYAICSFQKLRMIKNGENKSSSYDDPVLTYGSMIVSVLLMGLGFVSRIVRLHKSLTIGLVVASRRYLSERSRRFLRLRYEKAKYPSDPSGLSQGQSGRRAILKNLLFYRPLLATYLAFRAVLDLWSSMVIEVWWLLASFAWGVNNLIMSRQEWSKSPTGTGNWSSGQIAPTSKNLPDAENWSFGQIAPIILLLAPFLSVIELIAAESPSDEKAAKEPPEVIIQPEPPSRTETMEIATRLNLGQSDGVHEEPDHDFYQEIWFQILTVYLLLALIFITTIVLFLPRSYYGYIYPSIKKPLKGQQLGYLIPTVNFIAWIPIAFMMGAVNFALFSLLAESWTRVLTARAWIAFSTFGIYTVCMMFSSFMYSMTVCGFALWYIAICINLVRKASGNSSSDS